MGAGIGTPGKKGRLLMINTPDMVTRTEYVLAAEQAFAEERQQRVSEGREAPQALGVLLLTEFAQAELERKPLEQRWMKDFRQYKGIYEEDEQPDPERSQVYIKKSQVKARTVTARLMDMLFPAGQDNRFSIKPSPKPEVAPEKRRELARLLAGVSEGAQPTEEQIDEAVKQFVNSAAENMQTRIRDQLADTKYKDICRKVVKSGVIFGTGVMKSPLVERKERTRYVPTRGGKWERRVEEYTVPFMDFVPIWRWYPDLSATEQEHARYTWERHLFSRHAFVALARRPTFQKKTILDYARSLPRGMVNVKDFEGELKQLGDRESVYDQSGGMYEVLERWGWLSGQQLKDAGVRVKEERCEEMFFCNTWILPNGQVIRCVISPFKAQNWLYKYFYFEKDESSIAGEGLMIIMRDDQAMINAAARAMLDNAAITAGPMLEVFVDKLAANAEYNRLFPFKVFPRTGGDPQYPVVRSIDLNAHFPELMNIFQLFDTTSDENTGIPKFFNGDNPTNGAAATAQGLSMLMNNANITIKDLLLSFEEGVDKPVIEGLYHWNMQYASDDSIKGDYTTVVNASSSLVAKELRTQQAAVFMGSIQPEERAYVKWRDLLEKRAKDAEFADVVMTEEEAQEAQNNPANAMQQKLAEAQMQLVIAELQAKIAKMQAEINRINAETVNKRVEAAFAALQAGGVAATTPGAATAGDEILKSSGWSDATPGTGTPAPTDPAAAEQQPMPAEDPAMPSAGPEDPNAGQRAGIETPAIEAAQ